MLDKHYVKDFIAYIKGEKEDECLTILNHPCK